MAQISAILITCVPKMGEEGAGDLTLFVHTRTHTSTHVLCVGYTYACVCQQVQKKYTVAYTATLLLAG